GEVDPLPRTRLQDLARRIRRLLSCPRLSGHRPGHRMGPVRRHDGGGRPRHRRRACSDARLLSVLPADAVVHRARRDEAGAGKGDLEMKTVIRWIGVVLLVAASGGFASEGGFRLEPAPGRRLDHESLQRGARNFVNYCLTCHSAQYMRYNRLTDLGLTEQQIKDNLMFATDKIGSTMTVAMSKADATAWFGAPPPDLSVEARGRGTDLLYRYLHAFYRVEKAPSAWNNLVFPNVAMPHVLWGVQGVNTLVETEYEDREKGEAGAIAGQGLGELGTEPD